MTQFLSGLEHDLENEADLKLLAHFDSFRWNIVNWKSLFTKDD